MSDPAGFVEAFGGLFDVAYRASYAVLGERDESEDCAQDTLARALVKWHRIEDHATPWVARVATNAAIDRWRRRARRSRAGQLRVAAGGPIDSRRDELVRALRALPRRQRDAVALRYLLDLSERDTAAAMGCSVGTVKSAASRGLARLRVTVEPARALEG